MSKIAAGSRCIAQPLFTVARRDERIDMDAKRVLFVCMGNICRSPAAEAVMQRFAEEAGVATLVESAGTHDYHVGEKADRRMRAAAEERGYSILSRGRHVTAEDLEPGTYDLVLAMDDDNYQILRRLTASEASHLRMFSDYLDDEWPRNVPDPYYGGDDGFEMVLDMLEAGCPRILECLVGRDLGAEFSLHDDAPEID